MSVASNLRTRQVFPTPNSLFLPLEKEENTQKCPTSRPTPIFLPITPLWVENPRHIISSASPVNTLLGNCRKQKLPFSVVSIPPKLLLSNFLMSFYIHNIFTLLLLSHNSLCTSGLLGSGSDQVAPSQVICPLDPCFL